MKKSELKQIIKEEIHRALNENSEGDYEYMLYSLFSDENNIKQNSIASLKNAVKNQFKGVEFDVWNINNDLIISHDKPKSDPLNLLPKFKDYLIFKMKILSSLILLIINAVIHSKKT